MNEQLNIGMLMKPTSFGTEQEGLVEEIAKYVSSHNLDVLLGPEWLFVPEKRLYTKQEKDDLAGKLMEATKGSDALIIPGSIMWEEEHCFCNAMPIISKGKFLDRKKEFYHKRCNGGSIEMAMEKKCWKRQSEGFDYGLYKWRNYNIGIEICADEGDICSHSMKNPKIPELDLYFLSSCGLALCGSNTGIRNLGYAFCADGSGPRSEALRRVDKRSDGELRIKYTEFGPDNKPELKGRDYAKLNRTSIEGECINVYSIIMEQ